MVLQFSPLQISCDLTFWSELNRLKLEEWKLDETPRHIVATLPPDARFGTTYYLTLDSSSLHPSGELAYNQVSGTLHLYNTMEQLKAIKNDKIEELAPADATLNGNWKNPKELLTFSLIMYADLKGFRYHVRTCVPSVVLPSSFRRLKYKATDADSAKIALFKPRSKQQYPVLWTKDGEKSFADLDSLNPEDVWLIYPTLGHSDTDALHWQVPNLLYALACHPSKLSSIRIAIIDKHSSLLAVHKFKLPKITSDEKPILYGWSTAEPEVYNLAGQFDRDQLMASSVDLNLKLTRWRNLPTLEIKKFGIKVLIIGTGALGCNVARGLMGWSVKNMTFVDCGTVTDRNTVCQSLFTADDIGKPKAQAAANALKKIFPAVNSQGYLLNVVSGHRSDEKEVLQDVDTLSELVASHDFVFICTDSRESRWLPTVLALKHGKPVITLALGYDSFLVMRHGANLNTEITPVGPDNKNELSEIPGDQLGCSFCLDAIGDSAVNQTTNGTSRSGLSFLAAGYAVELFASLVQHRQGPHAPARLITVDDSASILGGTPHQVRGCLRSSSMKTLTTTRSSDCSACGPGSCSKLTSGLHDFVMTFDHNQNHDLKPPRSMSDLKNDKLKVKVLIIGAGTLGCNVARGLIGWNVRNITFIDCGTVSISNPVRQSLFIADDIGKPKAQAAAMALKRILPSIELHGISLKVVMPGHPAGETEVLHDVDILDKLVSSHDYVFLCTDSREARWLPTVLALKHEKPVINLALGFDSFVVMRHGLPNLNTEPAPVTLDYKNKLLEIPGDQLGCYFCSDITAPGDSTKDRALDQQCTISRSGLSFLAAGYAVELFASVVQHPKGPHAPARLITVDDNASILGGTPHQIRGFLRSSSMITPTTMRSSVCSACGPVICSKLASQEDFQNIVLTAVNDPRKLEAICGITELQKISEDLEGTVLLLSDDEFVE